MYSVPGAGLRYGLLRVDDQAGPKLSVPARVIGRPPFVTLAKPMRPPPPIRKTFRRLGAGVEGAIVASRAVLKLDDGARFVWARVPEVEAKAMSCPSSE